MRLSLFIWSRTSTTKALCSLNPRGRDRIQDYGRDPHNLAPRSQIKDTGAPAGAPPGLPTPEQAFISYVPPNEVNAVPNTNPVIILDCPIFAIGPLSNPWDRPQSDELYRIPQGRLVDPHSVEGSRKSPLVPISGAGGVSRLLQLAQHEL